MTKRLTVSGMVLISLSFVVAMLASHLSAKSNMAVANEEAEKEINAVFDAQTAAWNRGDIPDFMKGYHNSPDTEFVGSGGVKRGYSEVMERYKKSYPDASAMGHLTFSNQTIHVLDPKAAYVVGEFHVERQSGNFSGVYTLIVRKFPEGWRIVHDHSSAYPEAANNK
jgi:uncharacterized protein (TIGR02246 family)